MKKPPSLYAQKVAHLRISGGEGALRWRRAYGVGVRKCADAGAKVRCGGVAGWVWE